MKILSIDTSCDETAVAVTEGTKILSNTIWSQASLHAKFGGVVPSLAKRKHEERIDFVVSKAMENGKWKMENLGCIAVTVGPGLAIALEVGIKKAKELSEKYNKPFLAMNHIEGHILSPLANLEKLPDFPAIGITTSGKHTDIILINKIGSYKLLAQSVDDAIGEALDKAARMLGFGYPGGHIIEKLAKEGDPKKYPLPIPLLGQEKRMIFSYSGVKTSMFRKVGELKRKKGLNTQAIKDLAASFQHAAFTHFIRVFEYTIRNQKIGGAKDVLAGGGVMANVTLRKMLRGLCKKYGLRLWFPYTKRLYGDNAAMIGVAASFKADRGEFTNPDIIDRSPNLRLL
jgi:N6-L-threonylcarbamoyladenine synthase